MINQEIFIGVDGGGTKTEIWVVDSKEKILSKKIFGSSNPRNSGMDNSISCFVQGIKKSLSGLENRKVRNIVVGMAGINEEYKDQKKKIEKILSEKIKVSGKVFVVSDQETAFRSGTNQKDGVVVIAGTGCVVRGWNQGKDIKASGWGWLADEGSACWVGQKAYQETLKSIDKRSEKTILSELIKKELKIKKAEDLNKKLYSKEIPRLLAQLSLITDKAAQKKDKQSQEILTQAGQELALATKTVINQLKFKKQFPLVLVGGMFKSKTFTSSFKKEFKNSMLSGSPVLGAIRIALDKK
jgi:N-acetylglucosamine kinase-like BadF-type ATPase